jgi:hypothetical protein
MRVWRSTPDRGVALARDIPRYWGTRRIRMSMKVMLTTLLLGAIALAQDATPANRAAAIKDLLTRNQASLRTYSWVETTQVTLKGEVKKEEQKQCFYGADGKVQKTPIGTAPAKAEPSGGGGRGGRLKERIVDNKVDEMKDYMEKVMALVHEYVPPAPAKIQAAQTAGNVAPQASGTAVNVVIKNYLKSGDLVTIGADPAAKRLTSYKVQSFVEKPKEDDVTLNVTFGALQDGTFYPQQVLLDVTAKKLQVKITNSGYKKSG